MCTDRHVLGRSVRGSAFCVGLVLAKGPVLDARNCCMANGAATTTSTMSVSTGLQLREVVLPQFALLRERLAVATASAHVGNA